MNEQLRRRLAFVEHTAAASSVLSREPAVAAYWLMLAERDQLAVTASEEAYLERLAGAVRARARHLPVAWPADWPAERIDVVDAWLREAELVPA